MARMLSSLLWSITVPIAAFVIAWSPVAGAQQVSNSPPADGKWTERQDVDSGSFEIPSDINFPEFPAPKISKETPLHLAAGAGDVEAVKSLLKYGADSNAIDFLKRTPLHNAVEGGHVTVARVLLEHGADINGVARDTPLDSAVKRGFKEMIDLLLTYGATINATTMYQAIHRNQFELLL